MRRRLLLVLLAFSLAAVAGFAVPLLNTTAANRTQQFVLSRTAEVARFAALAREAATGGDRTQLVDEVAAHTGLFNDAVVIVDARRRVIVENGMRAREPEVAAALDAALRNQPSRPPADLRPWSGGSVLFGQPIGTGTRVAGAVVLRSSVSPAVSDITVRWAIILLAAAAATAVCVLLALRLSRWVLRPVQQLTDGVRAVASGKERTHVTVVAGPAELRGLADSFNQMSDALAESADRQRRLVADASHQLRNPMAALRLRIDTLAAHGGPLTGNGEYDSMVRELERLESLLDGMLALASADSKATELAAGATEARCDAHAVLADRIEAWHGAAENAGVRLSCPEPAAEELPVACADSELAQVIDVVLDNAIKYSGIDSTVSCRCLTAQDLVLVVIADDGPGVPAGELPRLTERFWRSASDQPGSGLGLAIADRLVTARGGTFRLGNRMGGGLEVHIGLARAAGS